MVPSAAFVRCVDILYLMNLPEPVMRALASLFGVAIRGIIRVLVVCEYIHASVLIVFEFIHDMYLFLWSPGVADLVLLVVSSVGCFCIICVA